MGEGATTGSGPVVRWPQHLVVWLARKDSNLRSPDPESVARIRPREPRFERAAGLSRPPNRGESDAHPEMSQMPIPKSERVCCPIWASRVYCGSLDGSTARRRLEGRHPSSLRADPDRDPNPGLRSTGTRPAGRRVGTGVPDRIWACGERGSRSSTTCPGITYSRDDRGQAHHPDAIEGHVSDDGHEDPASP